MSVNQYIGAAYVAHGFTPWNAQTSYDGMYVVEYQNGNYISKKPVPAGVAPAGNQQNNEYWFWFGVKSAQIEEYRQQVQQVQNEIEETNKNVNLLFKNLIILSDSYASPSWNNVGLFNPLLNILTKYIPQSNIKTAYANGASFGRTGFLFQTLLENMAPSEAVSDIIIIGGYNDTIGYWYGNHITEQSEADGIANFCNYAKTNFPNAKITFINVSFTGYGTNIGNNQLRVQLIYHLNFLLNEFYKNGVNVVDIPETLMFTGSQINDNIHPSTAGINAIANVTAAYILHGNINTNRAYRLLNSQVTPAEGVTLTGFQYYETLFDKTKTLTIPTLSITFASPVNLVYNADLPIFQYNAEHTIINTNFMSYRFMAYNNFTVNGNRLSGNGNYASAPFVYAKISDNKFSLSLADQTVGINDITTLSIQGFHAVFDSITA